MSDKVEVLGCLVDNLSMDETVDKVDELVKSELPHQHVVVNVNKIIAAHNDSELLQIINDCSLVNVDGMPIVWISKLLGKPLKERVAGVDLFHKLMVESGKKKWSVYLLGAKEEVVLDVKKHYEELYEDINIVGYNNGYWTADEEVDVVNKIKAAKPDLLFVAMGSPNKEEFLSKHQKSMKVRFAMGVGGTFDVVSGKVARAPQWMQNYGLEWFFRFLQEPKRMFRRYFISGFSIIPIVIKYILKRRN